METARVGNNAVTCCPCCDELFTMKVAGETAPPPLGELREMLEGHLEQFPKCREYMDNLPTLADVKESIGPILKAQREAREDRIDNDPNNGKAGYWLVQGTRNEARTFASSAREAIEKCSGVVHDWESPEATFIGETLPEVF